MKRTLLNRILFSVVILFALTFFVFLLSNMIRGNQLDVLLAGEDGGMSEETYNALMTEMGLDRPIPVRYLDWLGGFLHGDMGTSSLLNRPVGEVIRERIGPTLVLTGSALLLSVLISIPLGIMSAYKPYSFWDYFSSAVAFLGSSMPGFMLCLFGIYLFAVKLRWVPTQGMYDTNSAHTVGNLLKHLVLSATVSGLHMTGSLLKQTRSAVLEVMNEDYIKTARSKGLGELAVVVKHGLRNALIPIVTTISLTVPYLVGGSVVTEQIFSWPGMGSLIIRSIQARDYDPVMAAAVMICVMVLITNILMDFIYVLIDPRLSKSG